MTSESQNNGIKTKRKFFNEKYLGEILEIEIQNAQEILGLSTDDFTELVNLQSSEDTKTLKDNMSNVIDKVEISQSDIDELKEDLRRLKSNDNTIPWNEIIKKEARGINNADLGKIQEIGSDSIITKKGIINTKLFDIPKDLVKSYDDDDGIVYFKLTEEEAINLYMRKEVEEDFSTDQHETTMRDENNDLTTISNSRDTNKNEEIVIPLMAEELVITKKELKDEITITKEPIRETKTKQVQLIHEEIEIERRPVNNVSNSSDRTSTSISEDVHPVESKTEIKIPLKREEVEVTKKPYVKEELVIRKKTVADKKEITDVVTSEELDTSDTDKLTNEI